MKKIYTLLLLCLFTLTVAAQTDITPSSKKLTKAETEEFFTPAFKKKNLINFPIFRAYTYQDKSGTYYVALSESADTVNKEKDTVNYTIKAFNFKVDKTISLKKWEINDFKIPTIKGDEKESSIWFWTKYCGFNDLDGDGLIDPIIVYGTFGLNGYDDGRAKILIYYKGIKTAIRHQNSVIDAGRNTQVDATFYQLPAQIQNHVKELMEKMVKNNHAIFPAAYIDKMGKKITQLTNE
ncbi:M949_RS01915 family surface polysaccharide biosynthesis protein [Pedobacter boryungensis]|uniref:Uncharacterized protein n=1 Tax=Pedobacter boryungensis TaxID=869962 RepID=A0ABX2DHH9_9SPHI|nr:hypothetical protein [Pedobacter boryungensis]NQX32994.1 hypothetical protein [Pedobacter boryungensis]